MQRENASNAFSHIFFLGPKIKTRHVIFKTPQFIFVQYLNTRFMCFQRHKALAHHKRFLLIIHYFKQSRMAKKMMPHVDSRISLCLTQNYTLSFHFLLLLKSFFAIITKEKTSIFLSLFLWSKFSAS